MTRLRSQHAAPPPANGHNGHHLSGNGQHSKPAETPSHSEIPAATDDQSLVERCRAGDGAAWAEMHARCHAHLERQIRFTLGDQSRDANLIDEIAARVWFGLVADNGHLLDRFQPEKGNGLEKYLAAIARFEVLRHQRGEYRRRRREHETQVVRQASRDDRPFTEMTLDVRDFLPQLTPRELEFFEHVLLGNNGTDQDLAISAPNAWQLRHRIRRKLLAFLELE